MELQGSVVVVTGASGGLGGCLATEFAEAGAHVVLAYRQSADVAIDRAQQLRSAGVRALPVQVDVATSDGAQTLVEAALAEFGRLDVLVNNAGINRWVPYSDLDALTQELWDEILATNLTGPFRCMKAVAPVMRRQQRGRIVNIASVAGVHPGGSSIAYAVSKAGLIHLTRCMAVALAPDVLVNSIAPGLMEGTRMSANLDPQYVQRRVRAAALGRSVRKEDVAAQAVAFARSDSVTGQTLVIDSGITFH